MMKSKVVTQDYWQRLCQSLLILMLLVAFISSAHAGNKAFPGKLYDIGTHRLHMHCMGKGSPTVVIDSGAGGFSLEWITIQNNLAEYTQVCSYDRAGYGFSDPGPLPRTSAQITFELNRLLEAARLPGPYVLVGHSFGGYNIRYFASLYPEKVSGMVLVDSSHPQQFNTEEFKRVATVEKDPYKRSTHYRVRMLRPVIAENYPAQHRRMAYMLMLSIKSKMTLINELDNMEYSANQLLEDEEFKRFDFPVVVISRGKRVWPHTEMGDRRELQWSSLQKDLVNISAQSYQFIAANSGHIVHLDQPDMVSANILFAVDRSRDWYQARETSEKYHIRLAHFGTLHNVSMMEFGHGNAVHNTDQFGVDNSSLQALFVIDNPRTQLMTHNLIY